MLNAINYYSKTVEKIFSDSSMQDSNISSVAQSHQFVKSLTIRYHLHKSRAETRIAPSQWEMSLQSNAISHWLGTNLESTL